MRVIMSGEASPGQIGGFLMALRTKGETVDELEGLAGTALGFARPVEAATPVVDTCGTGGDRSGTFNISTIAAIVVAGAGVPVAKHGNRAASSHCGSADVLESLGVNIDLDATGVQRCLAEAGIGFMFAPMFHPAAAHAGPVRGELRVPTVFNFLGPLTNPARPFAQVVGVSDERMLPLMAEVLARHKTKKVMIAMDALAPTLDGIENGTITATLAQKPFTMGYYSLRLIADLNLNKQHSAVDFAGNPNSRLPRFVDTGVALVDKSNLSAYREAGK